MEVVTEKVKNFYSLVVGFLTPFMKIFYPYEVIGNENIPEGPAILCANHSNLIDPVLVAIAMDRKKHFAKFMGKKELFNKPILGNILSKMGGIPVDRDQNDIEAVKTTLATLKDGEKVMIFPEGTRQSEDGHEAKVGVVRIAIKTKVPLVPIYIPRQKKLFKKVKIIIGESYYLESVPKDEYRRLTDELMENIKILGAGA